MVFHWSLSDIIIIIIIFALLSRFYAILHRVFTWDALGWGKIVIICIYIFTATFGWCILVTLIILSEGDEQFRKAQFCVFRKYFVKVFIYTFLDFTLSSNNYSNGCCFKVPHFLSFQVFVFTFFIIFFN